MIVLKKKNNFLYGHYKNILHCFCNKTDKTIFYNYLDNVTDEKIKGYKEKWISDVFKQSIDDYKSILSDKYLYNDFKNIQLIHSSEYIDFNTQQEVLNNFKIQNDLLKEIAFSNRIWSIIHRLNTDIMKFYPKEHLNVCKFEKKMKGYKNFSLENFSENKRKPIRTYFNSISSEVDILNRNSKDLFRKDIGKTKSTIITNNLNNLINLLIDKKNTLFVNMI